jgi:hypothetical protein
MSLKLLRVSLWSSLAELKNTLTFYPNHVLYPIHDNIALCLGVVYNIIMYTGSVVKSGSRAQAYITLTGVTMASSEIHLKSPALQSNVQAST